MGPKYFPKPSDFRKWLEKNHEKKLELLVGFYKVGSGMPSLTWSQSVDEAICFGWIDGVRRSIDKDRYCIRFTPRKPGSTWSSINIRKVNDLNKKGLMRPAGQAAFAKMDTKKSGIYSYEIDPVPLSPDFLKKFKGKPKAWNFFSGEAPSYQKTAIHWVMRAKTEETRHRRLANLIADSGAGLRVRHLRYNTRNTNPR
jgi:uncharacterized protein YdeI (YjbR/CyaY-like superfamily)